MQIARRQWVWEPGVEMDRPLRPVCSGVWSQPYRGAEDQQWSRAVQVGLTQAACPAPRSPPDRGRRRRRALPPTPWQAGFANNPPPYPRACRIPTQAARRLPGAAARHRRMRQPTDRAGACRKDGGGGSPCGPGLGTGGAVRAPSLPGPCRSRPRIGASRDDPVHPSSRLRPFSRRCSSISCNCAANACR